MSSALDHYNSYTTDSRLQWEGIQSKKFGKSKFFMPRRDIIKKGLDVPSQTAIRGKVHYSQKNSPQKQFRSIVKIIPTIEHWHPRESRKKIFDQNFTLPHPRRQMGHIHQQAALTDRSAGIRTFYNTRVRQNNIKQYSVEDRMQRKKKIDQYELRKTFFLQDSGNSYL